MRDKYYSDDRDLIKWATLTHISSACGLQTILQVPYWRPETDHPHFHFIGTRVAVSDAVWAFFRDINHITRLGPEAGVTIAVVDTVFDPKRRDAYLSEIKARIQRAKRPLILFLDPDTGLQPATCRPEHTAKGEIQALWPLLEPREWLILYQHARHTSGWQESVANEVSSLCNGTKAHIVRSEDIGKDVAFICVEKGRA